MTTSRKITNSLRKYLSTHETHSIIYDANSDIDITYESVANLIAQKNDLIFN